MLALCIPVRCTLRANLILAVQPTRKFMSASITVIKSSATLPELSPYSIQPYLNGGNGYAGARNQTARNGITIPSYPTTPLRVPAEHDQLFLDLCTLYRCLYNYGLSGELMAKIAEIVYNDVDSDGKRWVLAQEEIEAIEREHERQRLEELQMAEEGKQKAEAEAEEQRLKAERLEGERLEAERLKLEAISWAEQECKAAEQQRLHAEEKQRELDKQLAEAQSVAQQVEQERAARLAAETKLQELQGQFQLLQEECQQLRDRLATLKPRSKGKGFG